MPLTSTSSAPLLGLNTMFRLLPSSPWIQISLVEVSFRPYTLRAPDRLESGTVMVFVPLNLMVVASVSIG